MPTFGYYVNMDPCCNTAEVHSEYSHVLRQHGEMRPLIMHYATLQGDVNACVFGKEVVAKENGICLNDMSY